MVVVSRQYATGSIGTFTSAMAHTLAESANAPIKLVFSVVMSLLLFALDEGGMAGRGRPCFRSSGRQPRLPNPFVFPNAVRPRNRTRIRPRHRRCSGRVCAM